MTVQFRIRSKDTSRPAMIQARVHTPKGEFTLSTHLLIRPYLFDNKKGEPISSANKADADESYRIYCLLEKISISLYQYVYDAEAEMKPYGREMLQGVIDRITGYSVKATEAPKNIMGFLDYVIAGMKAGTIKYMGEDYDDDTIKNWSWFRTVYSRFEPYYEMSHATILTWSRIDEDVANTFVDFCRESGFMTKTTNKLIIIFKALINQAKKAKLTDGEQVSCFHKIKEIQGCAQTKVYLNSEELQALYEMKLEPDSLQDRARDMFLIGCYTCQRVSDYSTLKEDNFGYTARGTRVIRLVQRKTRNAVCIPILNDNLLTIVRKYSYNMPTMCDVLINRYIKVVCKELSKAVPSLAKPIKTTLTSRDLSAEAKGTVNFKRDKFGNTYKPKYDMITSHTARRSGITNLYKTRLFSTVQLMSISGHKSEKTFFGYLCQTTEELAEEITDIMAREKLASLKGVNENLF